MRVLDLFSGIGGFSLGLERAGMETIAFCETDPYCRQVLQKHWPNVPIHNDIKELDGRQYTGSVELVCGGFPCQPFSVAGKRAGTADDRSLWSEMLRIIREVQPAWVIGENVPGIINMELDQVLSDLESSGYSCQTFDIPACAVDAPHIRHRVWVVAHTKSERHRKRGEAGNISEKDGRQDGQVFGELGRTSSEPQPLANPNSERVRQQPKPLTGSGSTTKPLDIGENVADTQGQGSGRLSERTKTNHSILGDSGQTVAHPNSQQTFGSSEPWGECGYWPAEPRVGRVATGIPNRVDRLKGLGNAVVPQIPEIIGRAILKL